MPGLDRRRAQPPRVAAAPAIVGAVATGAARPAVDRALLGGLHVLSRRGRAELDRRAGHRRGGRVPRLAAGRAARPCRAGRPRIRSSPEPSAPPLGRRRRTRNRAPRRGAAATGRRARPRRCVAPGRRRRRSRGRPRTGAWPLSSASGGAEGVVVEAGHAAAGVVHDRDVGGAEGALADGQRAQHVVGHQAPGIAQHVCIAEFELERGQRVDPGVHAGDDDELAARLCGKHGPILAGNAQRRRSVSPT